MRSVARPSHADYTAYLKYHGYEDFRGGGHFSGRITAALVAAGAIAEIALSSLGISLATHIKYCGGISDRDFDNIQNDINKLKDTSFPVLSDCADGMVAAIEAVKSECDSIGGIIETAVTGIPGGVGEPWFDSVESMISHAIFSVGGIKGIEFGSGFGFADKKGSEANDSFNISDGKVITSTNNNAGINGGITNGMPIIFRCAVKPTPSIAKQQHTVDFIKNENTSLSVKGRHDPAIIRRICPVVDAVTAITVCDLLASRYGTDVFLKGIR